MSDLSEKDLKSLHSKWIDEIAKIESVESVQKHFIKHAQEIVKTKDPQLWAASTENLLEIYCKVLGIDYDVTHKISRMARHHVKNKSKGPKPPKEVNLEDWVEKEIIEAYK